LRRGIRLIRLAATVGDGLRVIEGRLWPRAQRARGSVAASYFRRRASGWLYRRLAVATLAVRDFREEREVDSSQSIVMAGHPKASYRAVRMFHAPDGSMWPTIPPFSTVEVRPIGAAPIRTGDVLLVRSERGHEFLGRLVRDDGTDWVLSADETPSLTTRVNRGRVIGLATTVSAYGVTWQAPRTPSAILSPLRGIATARWELLRLRLGFPGRRHDNAPRVEPV